MTDEGKRPTEDHEVLEEHVVGIRTIESANASAITFCVDEDEEVLRVTPEGFFVRGRPVDVGDVEEHDREVYRALREFLDRAGVGK